MLLTLPAIASGVPATITFNAPNRHYLALAGCMASAGLLRKRDLAPLEAEQLTYQEVHALIESVWRRELEALFTFKLLPTTVHLHLPGLHGAPGEYPGTPEHPACCITLAGNGDREVFFVESAVTALEHESPGLGYTALSAIDDALGMFCTPCTPFSARYIAERIYWSGEEDEQAAAEVYGDDEPSDDVPRKADLAAGLPAWVFDHKAAKILSSRRFAQSCAKLRDHPLEGFLGAAAKLDRIINRYRRSRKRQFWDRFMATTEAEDSCGFEHFDPPAALRWNNDDQLLRIYDDLYQMEMDTGECAPCQRYVHFEFDPMDIHASLRRARNTGRVCQALDQALVALNDWNKTRT